MKIVMMVISLAFSVMMLVRIIEMSIQFDGVDIIWTTVFLLGALICGASSAASDDV